MAVEVKDIAALEGKELYNTSNEEVVLQKDMERVINTPEFKILGFLNGYMYCSTGSYVSKNTLDGVQISEVKIEVDHAAFCEGTNYFYGFNDSTICKINDRLLIEWEKDLHDEIQSLETDCKGDLYVLFTSSRILRKFLDTGEEVLFIDGSDDPSKQVKLFDCTVSKGAGWLYVIGTEYWDYNNKTQSFIDIYNTRTWDKERIIIVDNTGVSVEDPNYHYDSFYVVGDYIYIYGKQFVSKLNIKGIELWKYTMGYNTATGTYDQIGHIEFSDNPMAEYLYFVEDLYSSNGHSFGKMSLGGNVIWKITMTDSIENIDFKLCIYQNKIYTSYKSYVLSKHGYVLSLDDNKVLFRTRDGHLIQVVEYNKDELYSAENYSGKYLLADVLKDDIDTMVYAPLRHDTGDIITETGDVLLTSDENDYWNDPESYDYGRLLASDYNVDPNDLSIINSKTMLPIITHKAHAIKTKEPYLPDRIHEFILNMPGNRIDTMQDADLVRARFRYSKDKYLLADRMMFFTAIITKDLRYRIITKKDHDVIIRKKREIYKYILAKYDDINLLSAWLEENGVLDTKLPDYVNELRHHTLDMINDVQVAGVPVIYDTQSYKQFEYSYDGYKYPNNTWGTQIFSCTNLPYDKRRCQNKIYIEGLANLIKTQEMRPILLFLNGKAVKWSNVTVVRDWAYSYLVINNTDPYESELSCIMFPCDIRYGEDNDCLTDDVCDTYFYFDKNGLLTSDRSKVALRIEVIDKNIVGGQFNYSNRYVEVENNYKQLASETNIIVFEDNKLFPDSRFYIHEHGKDIFSYSRDTSKALFKTFYWIKGNDYYGLLYKIPNGSYVKDVAISSAKGGSSAATDNFNIPFSFKMYRDKPYSENVSNAVRYIMRYDMSLLVQYYKDQSNLRSYVYDGEYLINRVPKDGGWLVIPRHRKKVHDDFIIVFRNNHLYEYYKEIQYQNHYFKIPIFDHVERTDTIEILHITEVDNSYSSLIVTPEKIDYIAEGLRYDNFLLSANSYSGKEYYDKFSVENSVQYDVEFSYQNTFDENGRYVGTNIKLEDPYYYNKEINIYSKRQFQYMYYNIFYDRNTINLSPDFRFCHDKSHYMVFKNWKILDRDDYDLHIMTNDVQLRYISLSFKDTLHEGDSIDIFYLPMSYVELDITQDIDTQLYTSCGDIQIDTSRLGYQYDKDLYMISINGYKLNYQLLENVDNHRCRITGPITEENIPVNNLQCTLYQFLQPDQLLSKLYSYSDKWSDAVDGLTPDMYAKLLTTKTKV